MCVFVSVCGMALAQSQDFTVECVRPFGIRITPNPGFRLVQVNCQGEITNKELLPPYDMDPNCVVPTDTGSSVEVTVETTAVESPFIGGFQSRAYRVTCNFPDTTGYSDTLVQRLQAMERPQDVQPTLTSGVFKFTGIMMTILDRASYAAKQWTDQLAGSAVIGQDLYLTITHPQREEGTAFIIPQQCRVRPESGNFTTLWNDTSLEPKCIEVQGLIREPFNVFTDTETKTDVTSLQFYGFQFLAGEKDALTFECDVFLCGDVSAGNCGKTWSLLKEGKGCIDSSPAENRIKRSPRDALPLVDSSPAENRIKRSPGETLPLVDSHPAHTLSVRIRVLLPRHHYVASGSSLFSSAVVIIVVLVANLVDFY